MKQLLQQFDTGELRIIDVPTPRIGDVQLLVETRASVISAGTERALLDFGRSNLLAKARKQPDKVRQVIDKARTDGIRPTLDAVRSKLQAPIPLGYCSAGVVVATGSHVQNFKVGDRVVTNAPHSDYGVVSHALAAHIPANVSFEAAAYTPLAAIALQGLRLAQPTLGETVVVYGLGLVGLLAVQLLRATGCRVIGIDRDPARLELGAAAGAVPVHAPSADVVATVLTSTGGIGADAVLLTLASSSDEPVHQAAAMSRKRGRLILVGVAGLNLRRADFYEKELTFQVSCSYGPGRYDPAYEEHGRDYPVGFVRWTEQRNFEAVLQLMSEGSLDPGPLTTHSFAFEQAAQAYEAVLGEEPTLGVVLKYPDRGGRVEVSDSVLRLRGSTPPPRVHGAEASAVAGVLGAGAFAQRTLLPLIKRAGFDVRAIASSGGTSAALAAERFGAQLVTTDPAVVLSDAGIGTVFILTRHDSHARLALAALAAGKHVFVEKPLALRLKDLDALEEAAAHGPGLLTVGFNRRHAPLARELQRELASRSGPAFLTVTVNAGPVPDDHWTVDPERGGGRLAGEGCHFIDLCRALLTQPITSHWVATARSEKQELVEDVAAIHLQFLDGSVAVIHYLANGARSFPKERIEAFVDGRTMVIDNWRQLRRFGSGAPLFSRRHAQDKGHSAELLAWFDAVTQSGVPPIPYEELFEVSRCTLEIAAAAHTQPPHTVPIAQS